MCGCREFRFSSVSNRCHHFTKLADDEKKAWNRTEAPRRVNRCRRWLFTPEFHRHHSLLAKFVCWASGLSKGNQRAKLGNHMNSDSNSIWPCAWWHGLFSHATNKKHILFLSNSQQPLRFEGSSMSFIICLAQTLIELVSGSLGYLSALLRVSSTVLTNPLHALLHLCKPTRYRPISFLGRQWGALDHS